MNYPSDFQRDIYEMLLESQYWPEQRQIAYQRQQLSQLIVFSQKNVPFYKERLAPLITSDGTVKWERWQEVPILKRQDLLDHRESMLAPILPRGHGKIADHEGTGTTGQPAITRHNMLTSQVSKAALYRAYNWHGIDYSKVLCQWLGDDPSIGKWPDGLNGGPWGPQWDKASADGRHLQINRAATADQVARFIVDKKAHYFSGRPQALQSAALAAERLGFNIKLGALSAFGTAANDGEREDCRRVFGAEIISLYASKEVYNIAHQCPSGEHFHVNSELVLLEVVDDQGNPCPPGMRGRAVITSFFNTAQPFIRYDIGDQIVMGNPCTCGRMLPVIARIEGRTTHLFHLPDGRKAAPMMPQRSRVIIAAIGWQLAQIEPLVIEVRYVSDNSGNMPDFETFAEEVRVRTDPAMKVTFKKLETLPLTPSGKLIDYVCELSPVDHG